MPLYSLLAVCRLFHHNQKSARHLLQRPPGLRLLELLHEHVQLDVQHQLLQEVLLHPTAYLPLHTQSVPPGDLRDHQTDHDTLCP